MPPNISCSCLFCLEKILPGREYRWEVGVPAIVHRVAEEGEIGFLFHLVLGAFEVCRPVVEVVEADEMAVDLRRLVVGVEGGFGFLCPIAAGVLEGQHLDAAVVHEIEFHHPFLRGLKCQTYVFW